MEKIGSRLVFKATFILSSRNKFDWGLTEPLMLYHPQPHVYSGANKCYCTSHIYFPAHRRLVNAKKMPKCVLLFYDFNNNGTYFCALAFWS